jgi:hypothetical protein
LRKPLVDKYPPLPLDKSCETRYHESMVTGDTGHEHKKNTGNSMTLSSHPWRGPEAPAAAHPSAIARHQGSACLALRGDPHCGKCLSPSTQRQSYSATVRQPQRHRDARADGSVRRLWEKGRRRGFVTRGFGSSRLVPGGNGKKTPRFFDDAPALRPGRACRGRDGATEQQPQR